MLSEFINQEFKKLNLFLNKREEILKIAFINQSKSDKKSHFFEILLKEECLNDKDIDLFDIEISYTQNSNFFNVSMEFYSSEGIIFHEQKIKSKSIQEIDTAIKTFVLNIATDYDNIISNYTIYPPKVGVYNAC